MPAQRSKLPWPIACVERFVLTFLAGHQQMPERFFSQIGSLNERLAAP